MKKLFKNQEIAPLITYEDGTLVPNIYKSDSKQTGVTVWDRLDNVFFLNNTDKQSQSIPKKYRNMLININFQSISNIELYIERSNINITFGPNSWFRLGASVTDISLKLRRDTIYLSEDKNEYYHHFINVKNAKQMLGTDIFTKKAFLFGTQSRYTLILSRPRLIDGGFLFSNMKGAKDKVPLLTGNPYE